MDRIATILCKQIDDQLSLLRDSLSAGRAKDYAEYLRLCGEIRGLQTARQFITVLNNQLEIEDE